MYKTISIIVIIAVIGLGAFVLLSEPEENEGDNTSDNSDTSEEAEYFSIFGPSFIPQLEEVFGK